MRTPGRPELTPVAADKVYNEDLSGGDFSGLLGLACRLHTGTD